MAYSLVLMTFVVLLIGGIVSITRATTLNSRALVDGLNKRAEVEQICEFFIDGDYQKLDSNPDIFTDMVIKSDSRGDIYCLSVYFDGVLNVYLETLNGDVISKIYY